MHCNTLTTILRSLWFFSYTNLIFGKIILRIDISSNDSYTLATATSAALCQMAKERKIGCENKKICETKWYSPRMSQSQFTWTWMVVLSNALNSNGRTSVRISSRGVFSNITWRFSNMVTVAWIDLGEANTALHVCTRKTNQNSWCQLVGWTTAPSERENGWCDGVWMCVCVDWDGMTNDGVQTWTLVKWYSRIRLVLIPWQALEPVVERLPALQLHASPVADRAIRVATKVSNHA